MTELLMLAAASAALIWATVLTFRDMKRRERMDAAQPCWVCAARLEDGGHDVHGRRLCAACAAIVNGAHSQEAA